MLTLLLMTSLTSPSSLYKKTLSRKMLKQKNNHVLLVRIKEGKIYFCRQMNMSLYSPRRTVML